MIQKDKNISPIFILFIGVLAVSSSSIFIRYAQRESPSLVIAAYRLILATLCLAPFAMKHVHHEIGDLRKKELFLLILSGIFLAMHFASWITSLEYTSVINSVVLVSTTPLWIALLSPIMLHERNSVLFYIGLTLALSGSIVVGLGQICKLDDLTLVCSSVQNIPQMKYLIGNGLSLLGAFTCAGYVMIGKRLRTNVSLFTYIFIVYGISAMIIFVIVLITGQKIFGYSNITYLYFICLALIPQLLGHSSFNWVLRYLPATFVSIASLGEPIGSTILAYLFLGESPISGEIVGSLIILLGIFVAIRSNKKLIVY